jgi:hypothetical protein
MFLSLCSDSSGWYKLEDSNILLRQLKPHVSRLKFVLKRIIIAVVYACKTWVSILRVDRRFRVSEKRMLTEIFGPNREEVTRERRELCNEDPYDLYSLLNIIMDVRSRN